MRMGAGGFPVAEWELGNDAELVQGSRSEEYRGEYNRIKDWVDKIINRAIPQAMRYPAKGRCQAAQNYWDVAPECLRR